MSPSRQLCRDLCECSKTLDECNVANVALTGCNVASVAIVALFILRWHGRHSAEVNENINLGYSQDQGYS